MLYILFRAQSFLIVQSALFTTIDKILSIILLLSLVFWSLHSIGYIDHYLKYIFIYKSQFRVNSLNNRNPKVAVLVPVLNESPEMVWKVLFKSMDIEYSNFDDYLIESSKGPRIYEETFRITRKLQLILSGAIHYEAIKQDPLMMLLKNGQRSGIYMILDVDHLSKKRLSKDLTPILEENKDRSLSRLHSILLV